MSPKKLYEVNTAVIPAVKAVEKVRAMITEGLEFRQMPIYFSTDSKIGRLLRQQQSRNHAVFMRIKNQMDNEEALGMRLDS